MWRSRNADPGIALRSSTPSLSSTCSDTLWPHTKPPGQGDGARFFGSYLKQKERKTSQERSKFRFTWVSVASGSFRLLHTRRVPRRLSRLPTRTGRTECNRGFNYNWGNNGEEFLLGDLVRQENHEVPFEPITSAPLFSHPSASSRSPPRSGGTKRFTSDRGRLPPPFLSGLLVRVRVTKVPSHTRLQSLDPRLKGFR